jgi:hypothetical protein
MSNNIETMGRPFLVSVAGAALLLSARAQTPRDLEQRIRVADREITRLAPSAFPQLPANLAQESAAPWMYHSPTVLCQTTAECHKRTIRRAGTGGLGRSVFGEGTFFEFSCFGTDPRPAPHRSRLLPTSNSSRASVRASSDSREPSRPSDVPTSWRKQPQVGQSRRRSTGIDDAFIEKASVVHYFHRGRWLGLCGAEPGDLDSPRYAESDRPALVGEDRDRRRAVHPMARHHRQQVPRLAGKLREGERPQRLGSPRFLAGGWEMPAI